MKLKMVLPSCLCVSVQSAPWLQQQGDGYGATEPPIMSTRVKTPHTMLCGQQSKHRWHLCGPMAAFCLTKSAGNSWHLLQPSGCEQYCEVADMHDWVGVPDHS